MMRHSVCFDNFGDIHFIAWSIEGVQEIFNEYHDVTAVLCIDEPICCHVNTVAEAVLFFERARC